MTNFRAYLAALTVVCVWSGWITISRYGVQTELQPADITLLRYLTALIGVSPLIIRHPWRKFTLFQYLVVGLGVGFPYTMLSFYGLKTIKAAQAGVLVNGLLPIFGALVAWFLFRQRLSGVRYLAIAIIFIANLVMAGGATFSTDHILGIVYLLAAAVFYTGHMTGIRHWNFTWREVLVTVPVVNTLLFLPLMAFFPSALTTAPIREILIQSFYQGIVVNILALMCVAYAISRLGTITVSLFMSFVPVSTALLAWLLLQERLNGNEIAGIIGCSLGLVLYSRGRWW